MRTFILCLALLVGCSTKPAAHKPDASMGEKPLKAAGPEPYPPQSQLAPPTFDAGGNAVYVVYYLDGGVGWHFIGPAGAVALSSLPACDAGETYVTQNGARLCQLSNAGVDAALSVPANVVIYNGVYPGGNEVITKSQKCATSHNGTCTMTLAVPQQTAGLTDVIVCGRQADGGANGGCAVWQCGVLKQDAGCKTFSACVATSAWASTDAAAPWNPSVSISSCVITATGQGTDASANMVDWSAVIQLANAQ